MVRLATSVFAAALLAVPALAASSEQFERSVAESDLYGRDFADVDDVLVTREDLEELFGRELINDIEERDPFGIFSIFKGIKAAVKVGKGIHKAHEAKEHVQNHRNRREFDDEEFDLREFDEDLEAREPLKFGAALKGLRAAVKFGKKHHTAKHAGHIGNNFIQQQNDQQYQREFEDEMVERDFDEDLEAREPLKFGAALKGLRAAVKFGKKHHAAKHAGHIGNNFIQQQNDQQYQREFEDEMAERDFDDEEFFERESYDDLD